MGIRMLNKFLQLKCKKDISAIHLSELAGKKVVVDISIYLYKFLSENALLENLYLMVSIFRENKIIPIFIFDGKPPVEKNYTIEFRRKIKKNAREEYYRLKQMLDDIESNTDPELVSDSENGVKQNLNQIPELTTVELDEETTVTIPSNSVEIRNMMDKLKKKFVILKSEHIQNAKTLLQAYGMTYYESPGEADILCAKLVSKNIVYACISEDTDMFAYGCNRVIRYLSLSSSKAILYDFNEIMQTLNVNLCEFQQICILFGCDYLPRDIKKNNNYMTIFNTYKLFIKYKEYFNNTIETVIQSVIDSAIENSTENPTETNTNDHTILNNKYRFYSWLMKEKKELIPYIIEASKIIDLFDISYYNNLELYDNIKIMNGHIDKSRLVEVMQKENFIFIS
jgi:5'-3' exonuclease